MAIYLLTEICAQDVSENKRLQNSMYVSPILTMVDSFQEVQYMPDTMDSTRLYVIIYTYIPIMKINL